MVQCDDTANLNCQAGGKSKICLAGTWVFQYQVPPCKYRLWILFCIHMRESPSHADGQTTPMKEIDQVDWQSVFFNKSTVFFVRYSCHVDQSRLNSFTSIGGHDCQLLNKLLWCLVSSLISVCFQRFIAIKIAEIFCSNHDVLLSWVEA